MKILEKFTGTLPDNGAQFMHNGVPAEGSPQWNYIKTPHIRYDVMTAREILEEDYPKYKWPVSGGWGYSKKDACIIELDNESDGVAFEYKFMEYRAYEELIVFRPRYSRYSGIHTEVQMQTLLEEDGKFYDKVECTVSALRDADYELLKADWNKHHGYKDDPEGLEKHNEMRQKMLLSYKTEFWFDITRFYGIGDLERIDPDVNQ